MHPLLCDNQNVLLLLTQSWTWITLLLTIIYLGNVSSFDIKQFSFVSNLNWFQIFGTMEVKIDPVSSMIGGIGAIICAILGIISNGCVMLVILKRSKIREHLTSPLLFLMCLSNFLFSLIGLPVKGVKISKVNSIFPHKAYFLLQSLKILKESHNFVPSIFCGNV